MMVTIVITIYFYFIITHFKFLRHSFYMKKNKNWNKSITNIMVTTHP